MKIGITGQVTEKGYDIVINITPFFKVGIRIH